MELPCARCRTFIPIVAKFCPACGAPREPTPEPAAIPPAPLAAVASPPPPAPAIPEAASSGPQVCPGCGMLRASQRKGCKICSTPYDQPGSPVPSTGDTVWVGVRCGFQCRSCGHPSPLNHLDVDGSVSCLRCGLEQVFDVGVWRAGLDHAKSCGVLAGKSGKFKQLGVATASIQYTENEVSISKGMMNIRSLRVDAGPGHPPCPRCHTPLDVELDGNTTKARCGRCGATQTCELPQPARGLCSALRGVIAEDMLTDRREAKVEDTAGAIGIKCAHCAAPLKVTGVSSIVTCEYCGASSRIPRQTMFKLGHDKPVEQLWWLAFSRSAAQASSKKQERERPPTEPSQPRPVVADTPPPPAPRPAPAPPPPASNGLAILGALGLVVGVGVIGYHDDFGRWITSLRNLPSKAGSGSAVAPPSTPEPPVEKPVKPKKSSAFSELCTCGPSRLRAALTGTSVKLQLDSDNHAPLDLDAFDLTKDALGVGLGCDGDRVVIAAGARAAMWSIDRGTKVWDRELSTPYKADRSTTLRCAQLKVRVGKVSIPTARGTVSIKIDTGL